MPPWYHFTVGGAFLYRGYVRSNEAIKLNYLGYLSMYLRCGDVSEALPA